MEHERAARVDTSTRIVADSVGNSVSNTIENSDPSAKYREPREHVQVAEPIIKDAAYVAEQTHGCEEVAREHWHVLDVGEYVKYINHAGEFIDGCFIVRKCWNDEQQIWYWHLATTLRSGPCWRCSYHRIQKLWRRRIENFDTRRLQSELNEQKNLLRMLLQWNIKTHGDAFRNFINH